MALLSSGGTSSPDIYIFCSLLMGVVASISLNVLAYFFNHYNTTKSLPKRLFNIQVWLHLVTGLLQARLVLYHVYHEERGWLALRELELAERVLGDLLLPLRVVPVTFVSITAIATFFKVKYPLRSLKLRYYVAAPMVAVTAYAFIISTVISFHTASRWNPVTMEPWYPIGGMMGATVLLFTWPSLLINLVSVPCSVLTVLELCMRKNRSPGSEQVSTGQGSSQLSGQSSTGQLTSQKSSSTGKLISQQSSSSGRLTSRQLSSGQSSVHSGCLSPRRSTRDLMYMKRERESRAIGLRATLTILAMNTANILFVVNYVVFVGGFVLDQSQDMLSSPPMVLLFFVTYTAQPLLLSIIDPAIFVAMSKKPVSFILYKIQGEFV